MTGLQFEHIFDGCQQASRTGSCIQSLAAGWVTVQDLCPSCTRRFMAALDGLGEELTWHEAYYERARGGEPR